MAKVVITKGDLKGEIFEVLSKNKYGVVVKTSDSAVLVESGRFEFCNPINMTIKVFNLTTLRKNGFKFEDGALVFSNYNDSISISGRMLNIIDSNILLSAETEINYIFSAYDKVFFIPKSLRGIMYKKSK